MTKANKKTLLSKFKKVAEEFKDYVEDLHEGTERAQIDRRWPAGKAMFVLTGYIETGAFTHTNSIQGTSEHIPEGYRLEFAVFPVSRKKDGSPEWVYPDGSPKVYTTFPRRKSRHVKSTSFLEFRAMDHFKKCKYFPELLGEAFIGDASHHKNGKSMVVETKGFVPAYDFVNEQPYPTPEINPNSVRLFLWDNPDMEQWNSLYNYDKDGNPVMSFLQKDLLKAENFEGSPLQALLENGGQLEDLLAEAHKVTPPTTGGGDDEEVEEDPAPKAASKPIPAKGVKLPPIGKAKVALPEDDDEEAEGDEAPPAPTPKAKPARKPVKVALPEDDDEE